MGSAQVVPPVWPLVRALPSWLFADSMGANPRVPVAVDSYRDESGHVLRSRHGCLCGTHIHPVD